MLIIIIIIILKPYYIPDMINEGEMPLTCIKIIFSVL